MAIFYKKLILPAIKIGLLAAGVACLLFLSGAFEYPEMAMLDMRYRARGEPSPASDIVIIGITQRCLNQLGRFPWPRTYHADLLNFLKTAGAKVVAMDIFFSQPDPDPLADQRLADSIKAAGNVILPVFMPYRIANITPNANFVETTDLIEPTAPLAKAALNQGHINMLSDADGIYRKALFQIRYSENVYQCLGAEAVIKFLGIKPNEIAFEKDFLRLRDKRVPLEESKFVYINFSNVENQSPRFAFSDVIKGLVPAENFKNKLVFVGQTTQGLPNADILQTPFKEKYGVTLQANIANTFLGDFHLKRLPKGKTCVAIFIVCFLTGIVMVCVRTWTSVILALAEALFIYWQAVYAFIDKGAIIELAPLTFSVLLSFGVAILYRIRFADRLVKTKDLELDSILQAGNIMAAGGLRTEKAYDVMFGTIINSVGAKGLILRWKDKKTNNYEKKYLYGLSNAILKNGPLAEAEQKLAEKAIGSRNAILIQDVKKDPLFAAAVSKAEFHSVICAPLELNGEVVGALSLLDKSVHGQPRESHFDKEDLKLFLILTQQTTISLENARLFEEVHDLFLSSIKSLAQTIDAKDPYTHGHSQRVTEIALAVSDQLGLDEERKEEIMVGSILHDIGKIGIKDAILSKPQQLTPEEKAIFDQHPEVGSKIMSHIEQLEGIIPIISHHHESFDGNGYPDRLKADQIPLGARIIAIADTFDAMTSDRPYRKALSDEVARKEINNLSGVQFDPHVVEAFNKAYSQGKILHK